MDSLDELSKSLGTSYINSEIVSNEELRSKLLINNYKKGEKVISHLISGLRTCDEFYFSVAFITLSGLAPLLNIFKELDGRGIKGKIITTNYLNFSEPKALRKLLDFPNIEVKVYDKDNFHTKGYIFRCGECFDVIIGSSNITQDALMKNQEWNLKVSSSSHGELVHDIFEEFNGMWQVSTKLTAEWISRYQEFYQNIRAVNRRLMNYSSSDFVIRPNLMQEEALANLSELRMQGKRKALLISATGTGKTYLSAFDVRQYNPSRMLFIVHREQIARSAMESFKKIFGDSHTYGILSGSSKNYEADFMFGTMQTISKDETLASFSKDYFDYIVIDEVHRAGASSYQKILNHFEPKFLLGMTATPERSDGYNIYKLFDYNIAYEIRLQKALEADMLCPFHYFGVSEISFDGETLDDKSSFNLLVSEKRVDNIIDKANFYGHCGKRVKGLVFCSRNEEAAALSEEFNKRGYRTVALSGSNTQQERENAVARLESDDSEDPLDYIFTVDIFNEGVDIPEINQIIMLRPTESAIIFVQQLGRGLRKTEDKDYVVVIDFIGNYESNFLIPIALSGDRTYNKDAIRKYVQEGSCLLPGCSTIQFDAISEKKIFESINRANFSTLKLLRTEYQSLKEKVGRVPTLRDFYRFGAIDPKIIFDYSGSYYRFLKKIEPAYSVTLSEEQIRSLDFICAELANGKRPHELLILSELIDKPVLPIISLGSILFHYDVKYDPEGIKSALAILSNGFFKEADRNKYGNIQYCHSDGVKIYRSKDFEQLLDERYKIILRDVLDYAIDIYEENYKGSYRNTNLKLYAKYSRKDVCRLLNWNNDDSSTIYGYRIKHNTCPIFVTYKKSSNISESTKYDDKFLNRNTFSWMTRSNVRLNSTEPVQIRNYKESGLNIYLFIKKEDGEGSDFYYLGEVEPIEMNETTILDKNNRNLPIVNVKFLLKDAAREDVYDYLLK